MTRLEKLRKRLGQCDEILLDAILMRHHIIKDIMAYKEENGLNILDPEQEERQKEWLDGRLENESNANEVWDIFHAIGKASKPVSYTHLDVYKRQIRISIGIEDVEDLIADFTQAIENI